MREKRDFSPEPSHACPGRLRAGPREDPT